MSARTFILKTIALFGLWILLSGKIDAFHLSVGLLGAAVIAWINTKPRHLDEPPLPLMRLAAYAPWLFWQIMKSGLHITKVILDPRLPINPRLIRYRTKLGNNNAVVLLGNSITLTPGTVTTDVVPGKWWFTPWMINRPGPAVGNHGTENRRCLPFEQVSRCLRCTILSFWSSAFSSSSICTGCLRDPRSTTASSA